MEKGKYLDGVKSAWKDAAQVAGEAKHQYIEKEHILECICKNECRPLKKLSKKFNINLSELRDQIHEKLPEAYPSGYDHPDGVVPRSKSCKKVFNSAEKLGNPISCLHFLAVVLENPGNVIKDVLQQAGVNIAELQNHIKNNGHSSCWGCRYGKYIPSLESLSEEIRNYTQNLTKTRTGKVEIIVGGVSFLLLVLYLTLNYYLPKYVETFSHMLHGGQTFIFILLFGAAEIYNGIRAYKRDEEIPVTRMLINMLLFSVLIYGTPIVYKWFIVPSH